MIDRLEAASPDRDYTEEELSNREVALRFYNAGVNERDYDKAFACLGERYVQHNPHADDGPEGFTALFDAVFDMLPDFRIDMRRVFVAGDMVAVHVRSHSGPSPNDEIGVDIFKVEDGRIVEHWDVIRPVADGIDPEEHF